MVNYNNIGSTTNTLSRRFSKHKTAFKMFNNVKNKFNRKYTVFEILAFGDSYIELLEMFSCNNRNELHQREGYYIRSLNCVNKDNIVLITKIKYLKEKNNIVLITKIKYLKEKNNIILITKIKYLKEENNIILITKIKYLKEKNNIILITKIKYLKEENKGLNDRQHYL
jgi:hypothetical protein